MIEGEAYFWNFLFPPGLLEKTWFYRLCWFETDTKIRFDKKRLCKIKGRKQEEAVEKLQVWQLRKKMEMDEME